VPESKIKVKHTPSKEEVYDTLNVMIKHLLL
jgi:hypothetical protein